MKITTLALLLFLLGGFINGTDSNKKNFEFSLIFASCFRNDTVSLGLNNQTIFSQAVLESDFSSGITKTHVVQTHDALQIKGLSQSTRNRILLKNDELLIQLMINDKQVVKKVNLRKGRILVINFCEERISQDETDREVVINQHRKPVTFE